MATEPAASILQADYYDGVVKRLLTGDRGALARAITLVETGREARRRMSGLLPRTARSHTVGVTGPPGVGKSSLCNSLIPRIRQHGFTVGVLAVDPSSPFTGGALLGDRVRMKVSENDGGVFIRSLANRGHVGGLSPAVPHALRLMEAAGIEFLVVETVGVGQSEIDIAHNCNTTIVVLAPGSGDAIQMEKAGLLEVADIFVVNKSDEPRATEMAQELRQRVKAVRSPWRPRVVETSALSTEGVNGLWEAVLSHRDHHSLSRSSEERQRCGIRREIELIAYDSFLDRLRSLDGSVVDGLVDGVVRGQCDSFEAADRLERIMSLEFGGRL